MIFIEFCLWLFNQLKHKKHRKQKFLSLQF